VLEFIRVMGEGSLGGGEGNSQAASERERKVRKVRKTKR